MNTYNNRLLRRCILNDMDLDTYFMELQGDLVNHTREIVLIVAEYNKKHP